MLILFIVKEVTEDVRIRASIKTVIQWHNQKNSSCSILAKILEMNRIRDKWETQRKLLENEWMPTKK